MRIPIATLALAAALATVASAQEFGRSTRIGWSTMDRAVGGGGVPMDEADRRRLRAFGMMDSGEKRFIFVYIRPLSEDKETNEFQNADVVGHSRQDWTFVKMDFDKENVWQKAWGITRAPAILGCDLHGNEFVKAASGTIDTIRGVLKNTPDAIAKYDFKLKTDYAKAVDALKVDEDRGAKLLVDFCLFAKPGYKETTEAHAKLNEVSDLQLKRGELAAAVTPETGVDYYEDLVKIYRQTSPGVRAEVCAAILDHECGNVQPAIQRLIKVLKLDPRALKTEIETAQKALDHVSKAGDAKIDGALALSDKTLARETVRKLAKDYAGTEAGKRALEAGK